MNLAAIRRRRGLSQGKLGEPLGLTKQISNYETGKCEPDLETLCKLSDLLGVNVDDLLGHTTNDQIGEVSIGGPNFKPDVTRNGLDTYVSKRKGIQERYSHRVMQYQFEKIKALCEATGQRPSEVVNTLLDYALARVQVREITRVGLVFEDEPNDQTKEG